MKTEQKTSAFVFHRWKKVKQVWNNTRVNIVPYVFIRFASFRGTFSLCRRLFRARGFEVYLRQRLVGICEWRLQRLNPSFCGIRWINGGGEKLLTLLEDAGERWGGRRKEKESKIKTRDVFDSSFFQWFEGVRLNTIIRRAARVGQERWAVKKKRRRKRAFSQAMTSLPVGSSPVNTTLDGSMHIIILIFSALH